MILVELGCGVLVTALLTQWTRELYHCAHAEHEMQVWSRGGQPVAIVIGRRWKHLSRGERR